jgi:hypothetical protein
MKTKQDNPRPAVGRLKEFLSEGANHNLPSKTIGDINKVIKGIEDFDHDLKLKDTQIATITKQKSDLQQLVTTKTSEIQSKNSLLTQKEQLLVQKEQLLSELKIKLKQEFQNKDQLIFQKEQDLKSLNDIFTATVLTKEEELKSLHDTLLAKNTTISEVSHKVKKKNRKLAQEIQSKNQLTLQKAMEEELRIQKEQEIERLRESLAQKDELLLVKE